MGFIYYHLKQILFWVYRNTTVLHQKKLQAKRLYNIVNQLPARCRRSVYLLNTKRDIATPRIP